MLLSGCKKDVSGSYLATDEDTVCWLQLVRTPDDHLSGQIVTSTLKPDGQVEHGSVSLSGAVNGEDITLSGDHFLGMASYVLSGKANGNALTLTSVQSTPLSLRRSSLEDYQAKLGEQTTRSREIVSARTIAVTRQRNFQAHQAFVAEVDQVIWRMPRFNAEADLHLGRFPDAEKACESITAKVNHYVTQERRLVGDSTRSVQRSELGVQALELSRSTDDVHYQVQLLRSTLETNVAPLLRQVTALEQGCRESRSTGENPTPAEMEAHQSACNRLLVVAPPFHQKYSATAAGLDHLEEVYKREKAAQTRLLAAAD